MSEYRWVVESKEFVRIVEQALADPLYAIDTEFHREKSYFPALSVVQLRTHSGIFLIDALCVDLEPLGALFQSEGCCIMHAASQDLEIFARSLSNLPKRFFDTQIAAAFLGYGQPALASLVENFLGEQLDKGGQLSDWMRRPLPERDLQYAAADVAHLFELYRALQEELEIRKRLDWASDESQRLRDRDYSLPEPDKEWWRLKSKNKLRGKARGIAQTLCEWRELRAREEDRPPRWLLSDISILSLAQRPARNRPDLSKVRGIDAKHLRYAQEILEAIQRGNELKQEELRLPPKNQTNSLPRSQISACLAWIQAVAELESLEASLIATRDDLERFVDGNEDSRLKQGWRYELVGSDLEHFLAGQRALSAGPEGRLQLVPLDT